MKSYQVILTPEAQADLRRMASAIRTRLLDKLEWIGENGELIRHQALQGDEWKECFKYRVGDYRIIYRLDHPTQKLTVLKIAHRALVLFDVHVGVGYALFAEELLGAFAVWAPHRAIDHNAGRFEIVKVAHDNSWDQMNG